MPDYRNFQTTGAPSGPSRRETGLPNGTLARFNSNPSISVKQGSMADWTPLSNEERLYYDALFQSADTANTGSLAGQAAVAFFTKSGLDINVLKQVWEIADSAKQNYLTRLEFYCAMRLIAMAQNSPGSSLTKERLLVEGASPLPLPRFMGAPAPPAGLAVSQGPGGPPLANHDDPYFMSPEDLSKYEMLFPTYDPDGDGFITGQEAVPLFNKSGLDRNVLKQIWELADVDRDARLSRPEFVSAMHLIVCVSKKGLPLPPALPPSLVAPPPPHMTTSSAPILQTTPSNKTAITEAFIGLDSDSAHATPSSSVPHRPKPPVQMLMNLDDNRFLSPGNNTNSPLSTLLSTGGGPRSPLNFPGSTNSHHHHQPQFPVGFHQHAHLPSSSKSASICTPAADDGMFFRRGDGGGEVKELADASDGLIEVAHNSMAGHANVLASQKSSVQGMQFIIQRLLSEKAALSAELEAMTEKHAVEQKTLDGLVEEAGKLQLEVQRMRALRQEQEHSNAEVRESISATRSCINSLHSEIASEQASMQLYRPDSAQQTNKQPDFQQKNQANYDINPMMKSFTDDPFGSAHSYSAPPRKFSNESFSHSSAHLPPREAPTPPPKPPQTDPFSGPVHFDPFNATSKGPLSPFNQFSSKGNGVDTFSHMNDPFRDDDPFSGVGGGDVGTFDAFPTPTSEATRFDGFGGR